MNPFREFNHFIAYFVPGVILFVQLLLAGSVAIQKNLLITDLSPTHFFILLIGGTVLGLLLDEARHVWLEGKLEGIWADKHGYDLDKIDDFVSYAPKMTVELYRLIRDEFFYFYEFDVNIAFVLGISAIVSFFYLDRFYALGPLPKFGFSILLLLMGTLFFRFGKDAYEYFLSTFVATMERIERGFEREIRRQRS